MNERMIMISDAVIETFFLQRMTKKRYLELECTVYATYCQAIAFTSTPLALPLFTPTLSPIQNWKVFKSQSFTWVEPKLDLSVRPN